MWPTGAGMTSSTAARGRISTHCDALRHGASQVINHCSRGDASSRFAVMCVAFRKWSVTHD